MINSYLRYQQGFNMNHLFPSILGKCACGCGEELTGRKKKWYSSECNTKAYDKFTILKGNNGAIRKEVFKRDSGYCYHCGVFDEDWEADHIHPVHQGGGACDLTNFQTLCIDCHKDKTTDQREFHRNAISSQDAVNAPIRRL